MILSLSVMAQEKKGGKDPAVETRKEQSAKADVYVIGKPLFDSVTITKKKQVAATGNKRKTINGCKAGRKY